MNEISLEERKEIGLKILEELDMICQKHNIPYYIAYGTLIGAVRHQGFIPWDDDIDVWIPSEYYNSLLEILDIESQYEVINHHKEDSWIRSFSKLSNNKTIIIDKDKNSINRLQRERGIAIDLFPIYPISRKYCCYRIMNIYHSLIVKDFIKAHGGEIRKRDEICIKVLGGVSKIKRKRNALEQNKKRSKYVGCVLTPYGLNDIHFKSEFESIKLEFCGRLFNAPKGYDAILTRIYGNYMKLPPKDKQISHHTVDAYWK